jgi:hypothetical protein
VPNRILGRQIAPRLALIAALTAAMVEYPLVIVGRSWRLSSCWHSRRRLGRRRREHERRAA